MCVDRGCGKDGRLAGARPPSKRTDPLASLPGLLGIALIRVYQHTLSAFLGRSCRYAPTCSHYTEEAIRRFGLWRGGWIGLSRILRCNPFGASGFDPVPGELPGDARWYLPWRYGHWSGRHIDPATRFDRDDG